MREPLNSNGPSDIVSTTKNMPERTPPPPLVLNCRSRSQGIGARRVTPTTLTIVPDVSTAGSTVEKLLSNGDFYFGRLSGNVPDGSGKYLWSDGCMYEGEWKRGKASGKGKFSWPSGATYEGEFKSGRMEGFGRFVGSDGDSYSGSWSSDRKHGFGVKCYANGDVYEGWWKKNMQDGEGRYIWKNGNEYVGEWKNGVINGKGELVWNNGNRYGGQWDHGVPKKTRYLLKGNMLLTSDSFGVALRKSGSLVPSVEVGRGSVNEKNFPRICIWESEGDDITCDIVDNVEASMYYRDGTASDYNDVKQSDYNEVKQFQRNPCGFASEVKRPGHTVSKGDKNYDLMLNLQLGIRYTVGKENSITRELKHGDFDPKEKFWTRFPPEGSRITPPHHTAEFRWKDYCPTVFRHLRKQFQVDPADYMLAICGNDALRELSSPGKSGSIFYLTQDDRFMIKTVKKSEVKVLIRMLRSYYQHVFRYENSLVPKFYGVHCVKPIGGQKIRFIVMGNLFCSEYPIHKRFDLKGSSHGRMTGKPEEEIDETTTLKDLDLNYVFRVQRNLFQDLIKQIELDCEFLEAEKIMDYSLLVGLHFREDNTCDKMGLSPFLLRSGNQDSYQSEKFMRGYRFLEAELQDRDRVKSGRKSLIRLGANMPARAERMTRRSDFDQYTGVEISHLNPYSSGETSDVILYFGIIDILQDYDITKKLEHAYKSLQVDSSSISAVDPKFYSKRFRDFVGRTFVEDW
ncbi:hypothetical protein Lal_00030445 [Lupinus albus]|uniref:Phosphatidylinositol 4-phosphate 5-kinase n=1 Tax=Lupinus albus TaxID=3870 RepID=A0A6A4P2X9_LUPAL|nr:putative 1-phosphatidylinositol-4-phosphate 5-kinase [Lupinus albus]KAF1863424.1 hypothetical protein Lal_00030445 [Lupinus albus]